MSKTPDIDNTLLDYTPTEDEAAGREPLPDEGLYPNCAIVKLVAHKQDPNSDYYKPDVKARIEAHFQCDEKNVTLTKFFNFKTPIHPKSITFKLMRAVFGEEMNEHPISALEGRKVTINIFHEEDMIGGRKVKYADFKFTQAD